MVRLSPDQFAGQFAESFEESVFRLELLDHYVAANEEEPFRLFIEGKAPDPAWRDPWKRFVRSMLALGRQMARVHVVTEPLSAYVLFEITCVYPANVEAGEDVRILPRSLADGMELPRNDYWLMDSARVAVMDYDAHGNWLGVDISNAPDLVERSCRTRDHVMAAATPLPTYLAKLRETEGETLHGRPHCQPS